MVGPQRDGEDREQAAGDRGFDPPGLDPDPLASGGGAFDQLPVPQAEPADENDPDAVLAELKVLREEAELLRRRLASAPTRIRVLEERLLET